MYTDHYGLTAAPFQLTPDARFWFESRTHKKAMAYLGYGLSQGEGFITITGEIGAGKTTLAGHLLARIDRARLNAVQIVSTQVEGDDVLRLVAQGLGLDTDGTVKALLLDRVESRLDEELREGKRTLVIVDEAQNLPTSALEELRMLSNFQLGGRALVQIMLLAQPEFRARLAEPGLEQLRQRVIATHHLEPMGADEIADYVRHRLALAGWQGRPEFVDDAWGALYRHSGGIPRRLNQLLNRLLLHGAVERMERLDAQAVDAVAGELAGLAPDETGAQPTLGTAEPSSAAALTTPSGTVPSEPADTAATSEADAVPEPDVADALIDAPAASEAADTLEPVAAPDQVHAPEPAPAPEPERAPEPADSGRVLPLRPSHRRIIARVVPELVVTTGGTVDEADAASPAAEAVALTTSDRATPNPANTTIHPDDPTTAARLAALEARLDDQDATMRRILTLLVDWAEGEGAPSRRPTFAAVGDERRRGAA